MLGKRREVGGVVGHAHAPTVSKAEVQRPYEVQQKRHHQNQHGG